MKIIGLVIVYAVGLSLLVALATVLCESLRVAS